MNVPWNYEEMAAAMQPHQFELLLRAYIKLHATRAQDRECGKGETQSKHVSGTFAFALDQRGTLETAKWTVCFDYGSDTRGEILEPALTELCRRHGWEKSPLGTLRMLSAPASES